MQSATRLIVGIVSSSLLLLLVIFALTMLRVINPSKTYVVQFFGRYIGTVRRTGLCIIPPLCTTKKISIKVRIFETNTIEVNDLNGNPIEIGAIVVWQISDTTTQPSGQHWIALCLKQATRLAKTYRFVSTQQSTKRSLRGRIRKCAATMHK